MARAKTYLSPEDQWRQTVHYFSPVLDLKEAPINKARAGEWSGWFSMHCGMLPRSMVVERGERLGIILRPHRFMLVGDVFFMEYGNGMNERYCIRGVSSKGVRLAHFYVKLNHGRLEEPKGSGALLVYELPDDFIGCQWDDPALCRFIGSLRVSVPQPGRRV